MLTLNDFSFLIVTQAKDMDRLRLAYDSIRSNYPDVEIVVVYENQSNINRLNNQDTNLVELYTNHRVYVSVGYNLALKNASRKCFILFHDDTFLASGFLENIIPNLTEKQFCNFTTVEPPLYNDPDTLQKPIKDFGRDPRTFDLNKFNDFCAEHVKKLSQTVIDSPLGGFFMVGYKSSMESVGGFDEYFQPYFYEDSDLIIRLHQSGYKFVHVLNSIVYHMGSLTSRGTQESVDSSKTTSKLFIKKWKAPWELIREYTLINGIEYKKIQFEITSINCRPELQEYIDLISDPDSNIKISFDGNKLTNEDYMYLQTLPYILQSIEDEGDYQIGNLNVKYKINE